MLHILSLLIDWSEVWALFIPLLFYKKQPAAYRPVVIYLWLALFINIAIDITWKFRAYIPAAINSNNYLYNIHSVIRLFLFSLFFLRLNQPFIVWMKISVPLVFLLFLVINFGFFERFFNYWQFSSRLLSVEAFCLLFYTLQYYLFKITENVEVNIFTPDFWLVTGLGIYTTINFFIFLLYNELTIRMQAFAISLWSVHNISFIILNLFIAKCFYESGKQ
ncbi:hypothetical protein A0256_15165 [Mucilaginibacter sp. PAMC 26640]|nr:hypothetical protein A0256_15165 [Mucilaginibacter sp. PAMC 26640]